MKQTFAILFITGAAAIFGFAKDASSKVYMPEINTIIQPEAGKDSVINFDDLSVKWVKNAAELNWTANTESNSKQFEIQRSVDGKSFKTIGIIFTIDADAKVKTYTFKDAAKGIEKSLLTYRIKQVTMNDNCSFSGTVVLQKN